MVDNRLPGDAAGQSLASSNSNSDDHDLGFSIQEEEEMELPALTGGDRGHREGEARGSTSGGGAHEATSWTGLRLCLLS